MRPPVTLACPLILASLTLAACSAEPEDPKTDQAQVAGPAEAIHAETTANAPATAAAGRGKAEADPAKVLGLEGLGELRIGQPIPADSSWASRGAQIPGGCRTISSPDYPGAYAIVENDEVQRITVGQRSDIKLVERIGVGATEKEVKASFPGFRGEVGSSRVDLQACKLEYSIVSPK